MATSSLATRHLGCAVLLAATMLRCGLSADGQGTPETADGGSHGSSSGTSSGFSSGDDGGASSGTTSSSGSGTSSGIAMDDASDPFDAHGLDGAAPSFDGSASGGHTLDGGSGDGGAGMYCKRLNTCCSMLQAYGASAMSVMSCQQSAQGGDENGCLFLLGTFQSAYLCFGV